MKTHKDLIVWQRSILLVTEVYKITKEFPKDELYGLVNQLRRAAVSIPSNIAEGAARFSKKGFCQFLYISLGSASELETQFIISRNLNYLGQDISESLQLQLSQVRKTLLGLIQSLKEKTSEK
jgi:four helix bundle protein